MAFRKIPLERTSNNLACALQCFLCLFCARFALLKTGLSNRNLTKIGLKIESFSQKQQKFFCIFFLRPPSKVTNFNTSPQILTPHLTSLRKFSPPFWKFFVYTLNSEQKLSVKKTVDWAGQKPVDRPINRRWFWNLPVWSGRENLDRFHLCCSNLEVAVLTVAFRNASQQNEPHCKVKKKQNTARWAQKQKSNFSFKNKHFKSKQYIRRQSQVWSSPPAMARIPFSAVANSASACKN